MRVYKAWFVNEAAWRHNRFHLFLAAGALVLVIAFHNLPSLVVATVVVGGLLLRIYVSDLRRTDSRLALRSNSREDGHP